MSYHDLYINLTSGLGNRLFKIASAYGIAKKQKKNMFILDVYDTYHNTNGLDYMTTIFKNFKLKNTDNCIYKTFIENEEDALSFLDIPNNEENILIKGYFQNEKYFINYKKEILELFQMEEFNRSYLTEKYDDLNNTFFIHIRRGDYSYLHMHNVDMNKYYVNCFTLFKPDAKFLVFSDDIKYCKNLEILNKKNIKFIDELENELDSLYLMSLCYLGGIAVNSTFSWWGSYMNKNPNKFVIFPNKWFNNNWNQSDIPWKNSNIVNIQ